MRLLLLAFVFVSLFASVALAGTVTPGLEQAFTAKGAGETLPVLIVLSDRVAAPAMADRLPRLGLNIGEIHQVLMDSLELRAEASQAAVLKSIEISKSNGMAKGNARPLWLCNIVCAELTRAAAQLVANMSEVAEVGLDETVTLHKAVETSPSEGMRAHVEDGVLRSSARDAWQLGFTGAGRILCVIGDGVNGTHPALASHYRGRSSGAAECWYDPTGSGSPMSCGIEATAMAGALCGTETPGGDTTGIAPSASWIAAKVFCGPARLSDVLLALQWAVDPDRRASTFNDVPDAIVNSWGMETSCANAVPRGVWEAVANAEALGPVLVFGVGNNGGAGSVRAPESLAECFCVGNADTRTASPVINVSSARGPSPCDPALIKPDLVAPGTAVRSAAGSGYQKVTSSSIAAAYTAGAVALMRQANPQITAGEVKRLLTASAEDLGAQGADNTSGAGLLDAHRALLLALSAGPTGTVEGLVQYGGQPISGAKVELAGGFGVETASTYGGTFSFEHVVAGQNYAISAGRFGFKNYERSDSLHVEAGLGTNVVITLDRGFDDNATHDQGWSLGVEGDNATSGVWVRTHPVGSLYQGRQVQPDKDAPPEDGYCFVTGNAASATAEAREADVSGGHTTLRSPQFSLAEIGEPELKFSYWFSNDLGPNAGSDFFRAQISSDGGATWKNIVNTAASSNGWHPVKVPVIDFVNPTDKMMFQFVAEDEGPNSLIEAAVDQISITGSPSVPEPPRDLIMDVQFDQVLLSWHSSAGATKYRVYVSGDPDKVIAPENLYTVTPDTNLTVPMKDIHFDEFYFQVTAAK